MKPPESFSKDALRPNKELQKKYNVGEKTLARWRKEIGVNRMQEAPSDFKERALGKTNEWLCDYYHVGGTIIARWRKETGAAPTAPMGWRRGVSAHQTTISRSKEDEAVRFLQKIYRPVYNRRIENRMLDGQYVVGRKIMSAEDMVKLAEERGFEEIY